MESKEDPQKAWESTRLSQLFLQDDYDTKQIIQILRQERLMRPWELVQQIEK